MAVARQDRAEPVEQFWNRVARQMMARSSPSLEREGVFFAMLNAALADACLAAEESQTFYRFGTWTVPFTRPPPGLTGVVHVPGVMVVQASVPNFPDPRAVAGGAATAVLIAWIGRDAALPVVIERDDQTRKGTTDLCLATLGEVYAYLPLRTDPGRYAACRSGYNQGVKIGRWIASRSGRDGHELDRRDIPWPCRSESTTVRSRRRCCFKVRAGPGFPAESPTFRRRWSARE